MGQPIENAAMAASGTTTLLDRPEPTGSAYFGTEAHGLPIRDVSENKSEIDLTKTLLKAQSDFIAAQHDYLHEKNIAVLLTAQLNYISVLAMCVDDGTLASIQERMINHLTESLRNTGVL